MAATQPASYEQVWVDGLNRGDVSAADDVFAIDCVIHITGLADPIVGLDTWKTTVSGLLAAFPDMSFLIDEQFSVGNRSVTRWHARGTHHGPFGPIPATGRSVSFGGLIVDHLVDGKVKERWEQFDQAVLLQQLGAA